MAEPLGSETFFYLRQGKGQMIIIRESSEKEFERNGVYSISIDAAHIHLFEKESGITLNELPLSPKSIDTIEE